MSAAQSQRNVEALCHALYRALKNRPCNCPHEWRNGDYTAVSKCARCVAISEYHDAILVGDLHHE